LEVSLLSESPGNDKNEGEMVMKNSVAVKAVVKDLVCGMDVVTATAAGQADHKGHTYYFCGLKCKEKFELNPELYLNKSASSPKSSGCGCC
jgi:YHS domain-containing protein